MLKKKTTRKSKSPACHVTCYRTSKFNRMANSKSTLTVPQRPKTLQESELFLSNKHTFCKLGFFFFFGPTLQKLKQLLK